MIPSRFEYFRPDTIEEALELLRKYQEDAKLLAGGQSLLSLMKLRLASPKYLIDLGGVPGLRFIRPEPDGPQGSAGRIAIGALTTYAELKESKLLREKCSLLCETTAVIGDVQVRNRGTIGGALGHADPAGDMAAAVLALKAAIKAVGPKGERWIEAEDFFVTMFTTALSPDEIITEIRVPSLEGCRSAYLKNAPRPSDFAIVGVAVRLQADAERVCREINIGVTGVTDRPYRAYAVEKALAGKALEPKAIEEAAAAVVEGVEVNGGIHASSEFRAYLARVWMKRTVQAALSNA
ncbi:MAG: xanthine dehydrogenase family protein subunit M [Acidobacteria bacterium]|nr:xanthine dehydrogenase family protein subunit M [Acidobacteriota bacterium]